MRKKKKIRTIVGAACMLLGALLVASALVLLCQNRQEDNAAGVAAEEILPELQTVMAETDAAEDASDVEVAGAQYIGYLSIPSTCFLIL